MYQRSVGTQALSGKLKNREVFALASTDGFTAFPESAGGSALRAANS
jgi:hypothetical protein